jgi:hypothetical protein
VTFHYARPHPAMVFCQVIRETAADGEVVVNFLKSAVVADALASKLNAGDWRSGLRAATPVQHKMENI